MILKRISKAARVDSICSEERAATAQPRHDRDPPRDYPQSDERGRAGVIVWAAVLFRWSTDSRAHPQSAPPPIRHQTAPH